MEAEEGMVRANGGLSRWVMGFEMISVERRKKIKGWCNGDMGEGRREKGEGGREMGDGR